jgi:hypothetical protein
MAKRSAKPSSMSGVTWRNRIVGHETVDASSLVPHPSNFRIHSDTQRAAVGEALSRLGWLEEVLVNKTSGKIVNGHLRVELAAARGEKVPVTFVELSIDEEKLALASIDPLGGMAIEDSEKLGELLAGIQLGTSALDTLLSTTAQDAALAQLFKDAEDSDDSSVSGSRLPNFGQNITVVLPAEDLPLFERTIRATDEPNRGKAIIEICRAYLDAKGLFTEAI